MNPLAIYIVKAALYLAAFYLVYSFLLSRDTMFNRNRAFILLSVISSFILPFITIQFSKPFTIPLFGKMLSEVFVTGTKNGSLTASSGGTGPDLMQLVFIIYLTGSVLFMLKLIIDLLELAFLIIRQKSKESHVIRFCGLSTAGFSALGKVFVNAKLTHEEAEEIMKHEQNHLAHNHFLDIFFIEIAKIFQWFNPAIYLFNRSLRAIHEYQADEGCLNSGISVSNYQRLLLNQVFKSKVFNITNSFSNPTLIKKRMIMMTKKRSTLLTNLKLLMVLPVIATVMIAFSSCGGKTKQPETKSEEIAPPPPPPPPPPFTVKDGDTTWVKVDILPKYPGGDTALLKYIAENTNYPDAAKTNGVQGRVEVGFVVTEKGTVTDAKVQKSVSPELDAEALRVVSSLPAFEKPGIKDGKPVPVWYAIPITFTLK